MHLQSNLINENVSISYKNQMHKKKTLLNFCSHLQNCSATGGEIYFKVWCGGVGVKADNLKKDLGL